MNIATLESNDSQATGFLVRSSVKLLQFLVQLNVPTKRATKLSLCSAPAPNASIAVGIGADIVERNGTRPEECSLLIRIVSRGWSREPVYSRAHR